ncbi:MAG: dihydroorotase [Geopsychrobacter sp.]|nr:dihydroorotase [Geopsychrobacter sp.]
MRNILIKNGRVIDPANKLDKTCDLLIEEGRVAKIGTALENDNAEVIDATGLLVVPGLIDMHVHLRDPGFEYKEDIISGTAAAAAGGVTSLACMPNTQPIVDNLAVCRYIISKAQEQGSANVFPIGSITKGLKGETLSEMGELKDGGCVAFSDDGLPVVSSELMRRALEYADTFGAPIISHAEDLSLVAGGVMNEGPVSTELGLKGIPWVAEDAMTARDIMLAELTGGHMHMAHVSTRGSIEMVRQAKARGLRVSCEATPHHFSLTDEAVRGYNTNAKMNPPLRSEDDRLAIQEGLQDGTIDAIATDHAPHSSVEKKVEFDLAANGIIGLETSVPLTLELVRAGLISETRMVELMSVNPAKILGVSGGSLAEGQIADLTVIDPDVTFTYSKEAVVSNSHNSPFLDRKMQGRAVLTIVDGSVVYDGLTS